WIVGLNLKNGLARQVFPCMDEPKMKTWFELSVTHKTEFQIMSSMPIHDTVNFTKEGAFITDHFQRSPPMSVGSLALFMHDFQVPPVNYENGKSVHYFVEDSTGQIPEPPPEKHKHKDVYYDLYRKLPGNYDLSGNFLWFLYDKPWIVGLNLKNGLARQVFPCMDEPKMKTWFELSVTHKTEFQIMSSMPIHDTVNFTKEGAFITDHFQRSPPMSVGSLALFMHDFQVPPVNYEN
ncbi:uncharacterized protein LOC103523622, partial [Diaphorina citri]|uniref:Uncharacterized protein LOC103523622 n=1 Tax=Diaphorina citri TaxID=121845 RepID=A0A1S3DRY3_DIACI